MGWNGSDSVGRVAPRPPQKDGSRHSSTTTFNFNYRAIFAGLIVLVLGGAAVWWFCGGRGATRPTAEGRNEARSARHTHAQIKRITKATPFVATNKAVKTAGIAKPEIVHPDVVIKPHVQGLLVKWTHSVKPTFTNFFENTVCELVTATPGERFLDFDIGDETDEAYEASLKQEIVINPDDPDEVKHLKQTVIDAREEVKREVAAGQKASDVIRAARDDLNKIADYRDMVQEAFNSYLLTETDPKEILAYADEANKMMSEYGAMPIDAPDDEDTALEMMADARENRLEELDQEEAKEAQPEKEEMEQ